MKERTYGRERCNVNAGEGCQTARRKPDAFRRLLSSKWYGTAVSGKLSAQKLAGGQSLLRSHRALRGVLRHTQRYFPHSGRGSICGPDRFADQIRAEDVFVFTSDRGSTTPETRLTALPQLRTACGSACSCTSPCRHAVPCKISPWRTWRGHAR